MKWGVINQSILGLARLLPIGLIFVFLSAFIMAALAKPRTFNHLFFTFVIPIVPFFYAWDGQASMPRIYTPEDIDHLISGLSDETYIWEKGYGVSKKGKPLGSYLLGRPILS